MRNILLIILVMLLIPSVHAKTHEFENFKLTKQFKRKLGQKDLSSGLERVWQKIQTDGYKVFNKLTEDIIDFNEDFALGPINSPDLKWSAGINGELSIVVGRKVEPTLDSDRWRVLDQVKILINARTFLRNLRDAGDIEISDASLKLFAGVKFSRVYNYSHFAESYLDGLKSNLHKLFFSFNYFRSTNFTEIEDGDVVTKEDFLSADAKFSLTTPSAYFMTGYGRGSIYYSKLGNISYHRPLPENRYGELDTVRMSFNVTELKGASLQISLQADFYELLNLTFLGAEYKLNYTKSSTTNMTFGDEDLINIKTNYDLESAFNKINNGKNPTKLEAVKEYITSSEEGNRVSEDLELFAFMWGKYVGNSTESLVFETNHGTHYMYRHSQERLNLVKSWWDGIINADNVTKYKTRMIENMVFEYEAYDPEKPFEEVYLDMPGNISFRLSKEYKTKKDKNSYRKKAQKLISDFKNIDGEIFAALKSNDLKGPLKVDLNAQVGKNGITYLVESDDLRLAEAFEVICAGKIVDGGNVSNSTQKCLDNLTSSFSKVSHTYRTNKTVHLASLKDFLLEVSRYSKSFADLKMLFGSDNVQLYGYLKAKTYSSVDFQTFFKDGESQGYGVIKDFVRNIE